MQKKFESAVDDLFLNGLIIGLNNTGAITANELREFDECDVREFLKQDNYQAKEPIQLKSPSVVYEYENTSFEKSTVTILPLSLEDEAQEPLKYLMSMEKSLAFKQLKRNLTFFLMERTNNSCWKMRGRGADFIVA